MTKSFARGFLVRINIVDNTVCRCVVSFSNLFNKEFGQKNMDNPRLVVIDIAPYEASPPFYNPFYASLLLRG